MDMVAENGIAAHWAYKENKVYSKEREQFEIAQKLKWYAELLKLAEDEDEQMEKSETFVETIKTDILSANVYVYHLKVRSLNYLQVQHQLTLPIESTRILVTIWLVQW